MALCSSPRKELTEAFAVLGSILTAAVVYIICSFIFYVKQEPSSSKLRQQRNRPPKLLTHSGLLFCAIILVAISIHIISVFEVCTDGDHDIPSRSMLMASNVQNHFVQCLWFGQMHYILKQTTLHVRGSYSITFCILFCNDLIIAVDTIWIRHTVFDPNWWMLTWFALSVHLVLIAFISTLTVSKVIALNVECLALSDLLQDGRNLSTTMTISTLHAVPSEYELRSSPSMTALSGTAKASKTSISQRLSQQKVAENAKERLTRLLVLYGGCLTLYIVLYGSLLVLFHADGGWGDMTIGWEFASYLVILVDMIKTFLFVMLSYDYYKTYYLKPYTFGPLHSRCTQWMAHIARRRMDKLAERNRPETEWAANMDSNTQSIASNAVITQSVPVAVPTVSTLSKLSAVSARSTMSRGTSPISIERVRSASTQDTMDNDGSGRSAPKPIEIAHIRLQPTFSTPPPDDIEIVTDSMPVLVVTEQMKVPEAVPDEHGLSGMTTPDPPVDDIRSRSQSQSQSMASDGSFGPLDDVAMAHIMLGTHSENEFRKQMDGHSEDAEPEVDVHVDSKRNRLSLPAVTPSGLQGSDTRNMEEILSGILEATSPDAHEQSASLPAYSVAASN